MLVAEHPCDALDSTPTPKKTMVKKQKVLEEIRSHVYGSDLTLDEDATYFSGLSKG